MFLAATDTNLLGMLGPWPKWHTVGGEKLGLSGRGLSWGRHTEWGADLHRGGTAEMMSKPCTTRAWGGDTWGLCINSAKIRAWAAQNEEGGTDADHAWTSSGSWFSRQRKGKGSDFGQQKEGSCSTSVMGWSAAWASLWMTSNWRQQSICRGTVLLFRVPGLKKRS